MSKSLKARSLDFTMAIVTVYVNMAAWDVQIDRVIYWRICLEGSQPELPCDVGKYRSTSPNLLTNSSYPLDLYSHLSRYMTISTA